MVRIIINDVFASMLRKTKVFYIQKMKQQKIITEQMASQYTHCNKGSLDWYKKPITKFFNKAFLKINLDIYLLLVVFINFINHGVVYYSSTNMLIWYNYFINCIVEAVNKLKYQHTWWVHCSQHIPTPTTDA